MRTIADQEYTDWLDLEVSSRFLRGLSTKDIAAGLGLSRRHINRILAPHRKLLADGQYAAELAKLAADGVTNLPTPETAGGRPGRPPVPLTAQQQAMRAAYVEGQRIVDIAKEHSTYHAHVRSVLMKRPSVLNRATA